MCNNIDIKILIIIIILYDKIQNKIVICKFFYVNIELPRILLFYIKSRIIMNQNLKRKLWQIIVKIVIFLNVKYSGIVYIL